MSIGIIDRAQELADRAFSLAKHSISLPYPEDSIFEIDVNGDLILKVRFQKGMWEEESE